MPATQVDGRWARKLTNGTRNSPTKRKQEPEDEHAAVSIPSKATKRVKTEALDSSTERRKSSSRSNSHYKKNVAKNLKSESESDSEEELLPVAIKKTSKAKAKHIHLNPKDLPAPASIKSTGRPKSKAEVTESTATERKEDLASPSKKQSEAKKKATENLELEVDSRVKNEKTPKYTPRRRYTKADQVAEATTKEIKEDLSSPSKKKTKTKTKVLETIDQEKQEEQLDAEAPKKTPRKRKTKEEKEAEAMPLAARTSGLKMFIGAHVSIATGVEKAVTNCVHIGYGIFVPTSMRMHN